MNGLSNYPPGVTGNEPQITGEDDYIIAAPEIESALKSLLDAASTDESIWDSVDDGDLWSGIDSVRTFSDAEVMTGNPGLVLRFGDGTEFQLTIVRSR